MSLNHFHQEHDARVPIGYDLLDLCDLLPLDPVRELDPAVRARALVNRPRVNAEGFRRNAQLEGEFFKRDFSGRQPFRYRTLCGSEFRQRHLGHPNLERPPFAIRNLEIRVDLDAATSTSRFRRCLFMEELAPDALRMGEIRQHKQGIAAHRTAGRSFELPRHRSYAAGAAGTATTSDGPAVLPKSPSAFAVDAARSTIVEICWTMETGTDSPACAAART